MSACCLGGGQTVERRSWWSHPLVGLGPCRLSHVAPCRRSCRSRRVVVEGLKQQRRVPEPLCEKVIVEMQRKGSERCGMVCVTSLKPWLWWSCAGRRSRTTQSPSSSVPTSDLSLIRKNCLRSRASWACLPACIHTAMPLGAGVGRVPGVWWCGEGGLIGLIPPPGVSLQRASLALSLSLPPLLMRNRRSLARLHPDLERGLRRREGQEGRADARGKVVVLVVFVLDKCMIG